MASTMHLFIKLPIEIRLIIWDLAMYAPRIVRANWPYKTKRSGPKNNPPLLSVNRESRQEALKRYEKLCGDDDVYADFRQDTIFLDSGHLKVRLGSTGYESRIQSLAVDYTYFLHETQMFFRKIGQCSELRRLTLVMPDQGVSGLSPAKSMAPIVLVKFGSLNPRNYEHFGQIRIDVCTYFNRIWSRMQADLPNFVVYLVKCSTKTERAAPN